MKIKSRRLEGAGVSSNDLFSPRPAATTIARLLLDGGVGRGDRLQRVRGDSGVELRDLGRLSDKALVCLLGEFGLNLDRRLNAAGAEKLLEHRGAGGEGLLRIVGRLSGDVLQALRQSGRGGGEGFELLLGELLELVECRCGGVGHGCSSRVGFAPKTESRERTLDGANMCTAQ